MRKLPVDLEELAMAMEDHTYTFDRYLDTKTGEIVMLPGDDGDPDAWPEEELERYERIFEEEPGRLESVPQILSHESYRWMEDFAESVEDETLSRLLWVALDGQGAFGRFKRVLLDFPDERERWFRYRDERLDVEARNWLEALEIEPVERRPPEGE